MLVYAAITYPAPAESVPTPPNSSPDPPLLGPAPIVSVYALPLSSRHGFATGLSIKPEPGQEEARYIAPNPQDVLNPISSHSTKKRRADALDRAVDKKIKKRESITSLERLCANTPLRDEMPDRTGSPELGARKRRSLGGTGTELPMRTLSRAASMSVMSTMPDRSAGLARSRSGITRVIKKEPVEAVKRSEAEVTNQDLLNTIVLEEMKQRGLRDYRRDKEQRAKSIMPPGEDMLEVAVADEDRELWKRLEEERDEYKNVFHHTVKAAVFSMRKDKFAETPVLPERMRGVVTQLLGVFLAGVGTSVA